VLLLLLLLLLLSAAALLPLLLVVVVGAPAGNSAGVSWEAAPCSTAHLWQGRSSSRQ
jgi:hypothetical protein